MNDSNFLSICAEMDGDIKDVIKVRDLEINEKFYLSKAYRLKTQYAIKLKMAGKASEIINIYETDTWPKLKSVLQKNLEDNRNEITLSLDLQRLYQGRSSIKDVALQAFVTGLNEPYVSMLRAKDPSTLVDAIRFLEREELVRYRQLPSSTPNQKPTMSKKTYIMPNPTPTQEQSVPYNKPTPMSVSTKTFRPQNNQTPMLMSNKTTGKQNYFQNYGQRPNLISEELFETEDDTFDDSENQNLQFCVQEFDNMHFEKNDELNKALDRIIQDTQDDDNLLMQVNLDQDDEHVIRKSQQNQNANETLDEITQHTQEENISSSIEITEKSLNHFKNQIIFQDMRCGTPYCKLSKTEKI
ncbi:hypothetical protein ILUMI_16117 [Ignelater luminosus]|uniref:Uncharacterized protein n=1 Tax=Ignelater luminosus TaxID=2038154 RepID=A0A8K0G8V2_IGNLU|nr:hypothetical protein ILUMI_16117 [Ignelater luminosus]